MFESPEVCNFIKKETQTQGFSSEFYEIFKNTFFIKQLRYLLQYHRICSGNFVKFQEHISDAQLEPSQISMMECLVKLVNDF